MYLVVFNQLVIMAFISVCAFIFARIFKVGDSEQKFLSKLLLYFINPCIVITSFDLEFDAFKFKQFWIIVLISLFIHCLMILVGIISSKNVIDRLATVFTNCGFVGIPLIRGVFGNEGVFYLMGYLIVFNFLLWTFGYYQISGEIKIKKIITNPNIIAVLFGIILFCMPFTLPEIIAKPIKLISDTNTAIAMVLLGILFANADFSSNNYVLRLAKLTFMRLVVCAIVNLVVLFAVYKLVPNIPDIRTMLFVVLICSMCPSGNSVPSLSCLFNKDTTYASLAVSITTIICIVSVPGFVALAELLIK